MTTINSQSEDLPKIGTNDADDQIEADGSDTAAHNRSSDGGSSDSPRADDRSGSASDGQKYRKRRRLKGGDHHRRWNKLGTGDKPQTEEKKTLPQQKDAASSKARFVRGKPMAPFNSNRYLMDQHEPSEVVQHLDSAAEGAPAFSEDGAAAAAKRGEERWGSWDSDDDYHYENAVDEEAEENFLAKEFAETYQTYRAERLQTMSKEDLIREFIAMETKVEQLETMLAAKRAAPSSSSLSAAKKSRSERKLEAEVARLSKENVKLTAEFEDYRQLHA